MKKSKKDWSNNEGNSLRKKFVDKQRIIQNSKKLKNTGTFIYEDFCKDTMDLRKQLWEKVLEHRANSKISYLNYRSIVVRNQRNTAD